MGRKRGGGGTAASASRLPYGQPTGMRDRRGRRDPSAADDASRLLGPGRNGGSVAGRSQGAAEVRGELPSGSAGCHRGSRHRRSGLRLSALDALRDGCRHLRVRHPPRRAHPDPAGGVRRRPDGRRTCRVHQSRAHRHFGARQGIRADPRQPRQVSRRDPPQRRGIALLRSAMDTGGRESRLARMGLGALSSRGIGDRSLAPALQPKHSRRAHARPAVGRRVDRDVRTRRHDLGFWSALHRRSTRRVWRADLRPVLVEPRVSARSGQQHPERPPTSQVPAARRRR